MRRPVDAARLERFLRQFGAADDAEGTCYLAGGATAVLLGWRESTIDVDLRLEPQLYRFPAVDPPTFRFAVERAAGTRS